MVWLDKEKEPIYVAGCWCHPTYIEDYFAVSQGENCIGSVRLETKMHRDSRDFRQIVAQNAKGTTLWLGVTKADEPWLETGVQALRAYWRGRLERAEQALQEGNRRLASKLLNPDWFENDEEE